MIIVDTPGTNVILQRQRLTEEFVPRSDLLLFVMSSDHLLTGSEVTFLRYIQQWKKKIVFVLNKSDLYQNADEFVGTVGGLGVAGLSASLLTSVLSTTVEDLLALGLCSAGGIRLLAISNFPASRQRVIDKVKRTANALARQIDEAMQNDLLETTNSLNNFVTLIGKPYQGVAEDRVSKLSDTLVELTAIEEKLKTLGIEIQNLHISR